MRNLNLLCCLFALFLSSCGTTATKEPEKEQEKPKTEVNTETTDSNDPENTDGLLANFLLNFQKAVIKNDRGAIIGLMESGPATKIKENYDLYINDLARMEIGKMNLEMLKATGYTDDGHLDKPTFVYVINVTEIVEVDGEESGSGHSFIIALVNGAYKVVAIGEFG
jgi:hypothetical protein